MDTFVSPHMYRGCKVISSTEAEYHTHSVHLDTDSVHLRAEHSYNYENIFFLISYTFFTKIHLKNHPQLGYAWH